MIGFKKVQITRKSAGNYVGGEWVEGTETTIDINASIQPLNQLEQEALPEGKRKGQAIKAYSDTELFCARLNTTSADVILYQGKRFEVIQVLKYDDLLTHTKAIAVELGA